MGGFSSYVSRDLFNIASWSILPSISSVMSGLLDILSIRLLLCCCCCVFVVDVVLCCRCFVVLLLLLLLRCYCCCYVVVVVVELWVLLLCCVGMIPTWWGRSAVYVFLVTNSVKEIKYIYRYYFKRLSKISKKSNEIQ